MSSNTISRERTEAFRLQVDQAASKLLLAEKQVPGLENEARRQLLLLSDSKLSRINIPIKPEQLSTHPLSEIVPHLSTMRKVSALFPIFPNLYVVLGIKRTTPYPKAYAFTIELEPLLSGVITSVRLDNYRALRMLLLAELSHALNFAQSDEADGFKDIHQQVDEFFLYYDRYLKTLELYPKLKKKMARMVAFYSKEEKYAKIVQILSLLEKGMKDPYLYLPPLLSPLNKNYALMPLGSECVTMGPSISKWLTAFQSACVWETTMFFASFKKELGRAQHFDNVKRTFLAAQTASQEHLTAGKELTEEGIKAVATLQRLLSLTPMKRSQNREWQQLPKTVEKLEKLLAGYGESRLAEIGKIEAITFPTKELRDANSNWEKVTPKFSYFQHFHLIHDVIRCIDVSYKTENDFDQELALFLPPRFRELEQISLIDLLQLWMTQQCREFPELAALDPQEREEWRVLHSRMDFIFMKLHVLYRSHKKGEKIAVPHNRLGDDMNAFQSKLKKPERKALLDPLLRFGQFINEILYRENWQQIFEKNPFAKKETPALLNQFYVEIFSNMRFSLFEFGLSLPTKILETRCHALTLNSEKQFLEKIQRWLGRFKGFLSQTVESLKKREVPSLNNFRTEASHFMESISGLFIKIEETAEDLEFFLREQLPNPSKAMKTILGMLSSVGELKNTFFSRGQPLISFLTLTELLEEEEKQKLKQKPVEPKRHRVVVKPPEIALPAIPEAPVVKTPQKPPRTTFEELTVLCHSLVPYCRSFIPVNQPLENGQTNEGHQQEHLPNLIESLKALEEISRSLSQEGERPSVVAQLYLKLGVALEQSAKLATALCHIPVPSLDNGSDFLVTRGRESLWKDHAPHIFTGLLCKAGKLQLSKDQEKLLLDMEKVVAMSRYPASARDSLSQLLENLLGLDQLSTNLIDGMRKMRRSQSVIILQLGLETCLKTLQGAVDTTLVESPPEALDLSLCQIDESLFKEEWRALFQEKLSPLKNGIIKIQKSLLIPGKGEVAPIDDEDETLERRKGTIKSALRDLLFNMRLLEESVLHSSPSLPLMTAESVFLQLAVILERLLLLPLAHLPCRSQPDSSLHYLWDYEGKTLRRNSHAIEKFVERLAAEIDNEELINKMKPLAEQFGPYLRVFYRYQGQGIPLLEPFKRVSQVRLRLTNQEELKQLDAYSEKLFVSRVLQPSIEFLDVAQELLKVYAKLLD